MLNYLDSMREFCEEMRCQRFKLIKNRGNTKRITGNELKDRCHHNCMLSAADLYKWLIKKGKLE